MGGVSGGLAGKDGSRDGRRGEGRMEDSHLFSPIDQPLLYGWDPLFFFHALFDS